MKKLGFLTAMLLLLGMLAFARPSYSSGTTFSLAPSRVEVLPSQNFTIEVTVQNVSGLFAWQLAIEYNARIINCTAAWVPENNVFAGQTAVAVSPLLNEPTNDGYNYTLFGNSLLSGMVPVTVGQGVLCKLNFTTIANGQTPVVMGTVADPILRFKVDPYSPVDYPQTSYLLDSDLNELPFARGNSEVLSGPQTLLMILSSLGGTSDPAPGNHTYAYGTNVTVAAIPNSNYVFGHWLLNSSVEGVNPVEVAMNFDYTLQPFFVKMNYTLTLSEPLNGTMNLAHGQHTYYAGDTVQVIATADIGYRFDHWVLDGLDAGSDNPLSLAMDGNHTLGPVFIEVSYVRTIYVRTDGSIDPSDAPVETLDNVTYSLTENTESMIVVQRNNVIIDGNSHTVQGSGSGEGVSLFGVSNVTVKNLNIRGFGGGVYLFWASRNVITGNNVTSNSLLGLRLYYSSGNSIFGNDILANKDEGMRLEYSSNNNSIVGNNVALNGYLGVYVDSSFGNLVHHNNLANTANQVRVGGPSHSSVNIWDDGFEGNYWSDYAGVDLNFDGIGDDPYIIDVDNTDHYPLLGSSSRFRAQSGETFEIFSNSTVKSLNYLVPDRTLIFEVEGEQGTFGFCNLAVPHNLIAPLHMQVTIDYGLTPVLHLNKSIRDNGTHRWIYFAYAHSIHTMIVQEDTTSPSVTILSPENRIYATKDVPLTFIVDEATSWTGYSLDNGANVTVQGNTTLSALLDGSHYLVVYANDTVGNMATSDTVLFTVDTAPPTVTIVSPGNGTYLVGTIPLTFAVNELTSWVGYSLDSSANVSLAGNTTLSAIFEGLHHLVVYASDVAGNIGSSQVVYFVFDVTPPNIVQVVQNPNTTSVHPQDHVNLEVTVLDNASMVKSVVLNYTCTDGSGSRTVSLSMANTHGNAWNVTIPAFSYGANVTYVIQAEDNAGNTITTEQMGYTYQYTVVPEYPSSEILLSFLSLVLLTALLARRTRFRLGTPKSKRTLEDRAG